MIFVSYPREREAEAEAVQRALSAGGRAAFVCHIDAETAWPGFASSPRTAQHAFLARKLADADTVVVLWDRNYGRAAWCGWEMAQAVERDGVRVVIVNLDATPVPVALRARLESHDRISGLGALLDRAVPTAAACSLEGVALYPAASLLEARTAPRFDARTRGLRELGSMACWLVLSIAVQLALHRAARPWLATDLRVHLWALVTAINVALTFLCAIALSAVAAARAGVIALACTGAAIALGIAWRGEPGPHTVTIAAAATGTFHVGLVLALRDRLLGAPLGWQHSPPARDAAWSHGRAAVSLGVLCGLMWLGLRSLDAATELGARLARHELPFYAVPAAAQAVLDVPVYLGTLVGVLIGLAVGAAVFGRVLRNYRQTAPHRLAIALGWAALSCAIATAIGRATGWWIENHLSTAISAGGGGYAGAQIGVLLAAGVTLPIAVGDGRLAIRHERGWGIAGTAAVIAVITWKVQSFPFAAVREGVAREILTGCVLGFLPVTLCRAVATRAGRILLAAVALHAGALAVLVRYAPQQVIARVTTPRTTSVALRVPRLPAPPAPPAPPATPTPTAPPVTPRTPAELPKPAPRRPTVSRRRPPPAPPAAPDPGSGVGSGSGAPGPGGSLVPSGAGSGSGAPGPGGPLVPMVRVRSATYGGNCGVAPGNVTAIVAARCDGQPSCGFTADNALFQDPRVGCPKDFTAEWACGERVHATPVIVARPGEGYSIVLACGPEDAAAPMQ